jgi:16S rRNA (guanine966-N2)-methyltransferase
MKHRVREATFNLVGPAVRGMHAIDLFAGTGALALEAISRGAARATLVEHHFPTARCIEQNISSLAVEAETAVIAADTFIWARQQPELGSDPWLVLCSPPYRFYQERFDDMLELIQTFFDRSPRESILVVESDDRLDVRLLPEYESWDVRDYPPARIALHRNSVAVR